MFLGVFDDDENYIVIDRERLRSVANNNVQSHLSLGLTIAIRA